MSANDIFYYTSSAGVIVAVAVLVYLAFQISISLKSLRRILDDVGEATSDVTAIKRALKHGLSGFASFFGEVLERGGVIYGKRRKRG